MPKIPKSPYTIGKWDSWDFGKISCLEFTWRSQFFQKIFNFWAFEDVFWEFEDDFWEWKKGNMLFVIKYCQPNRSAIRVLNQLFKTL